MAGGVSGIQGISAPRIDGVGGARNNGPAPAGADFGTALKEAVSALQDLGNQADASALQLASGEPVDVHEVMLAMEQASLGFQTAVQVRNKLVEGYQEIMRMSV